MGVRKRLYRANLLLIIYLNAKETIMKHVFRSFLVHISNGVINSDMKNQTLFSDQAVIGTASLSLIRS